MARFSSMILILAMLVFAGQSNAFSFKCYAGCMIACVQGGSSPGGASSHVHQQQQQQSAVVFDSNTYNPDGLVSCAVQCMKTCVNPPAMPPPEAPVDPVPPTPEAPQVPAPLPPTPVAPVPPTPEAPQVPAPVPPTPVAPVPPTPVAPVPPTPEAPQAPEAPVAAAPQPSSASAPAPSPCVAVAEEEKVVGLASYLNQYCELGCAARLCATLSTPSNLAPAGIKNCVHNCSEMCKRKY